jgi:predicted CXXCH cytochrome family protein
MLMPVVFLLASGCWLWSEEAPPPPPPPPPTAKTPAQAPPPGGLLTQGESRRDCAVCHLSWVASFQSVVPGHPLLIDQPPFITVAERETCLGCHDGSVTDDRRKVWLDRDHQSGVVPPSSMTVPDVLPLSDGRLVCRTCHAAHTGRGPETLTNTIFTRVSNEASQLCWLCHPTMTKGPGLGTHPIGGMPWPVPEKLVAAGAQVGPAAGQLICQTCHTAHGAPDTHHLVLGTESSQLCLTCHEKLRPGLWEPGAPREHPLHPRLRTEAQFRAIKDMGTKIGPGDRLICLSCHKVHHGLAGRYMLAATLKDSHLCVLCHPGRESMFGTVHDLRVSAPTARNLLGQTPAESGPCGACHSFHEFSRRPAPTKLDPTGLCATCHRPGQCAEKETGLPFSHPDDVGPKNLPAGATLELYPQLNDPAKLGLACLTCHDPHETRHPHFLRMKPSALCAQCHPGEDFPVAGKHDFTNRPQLRNGRDQTAAQTGKCGFCHAVHKANGPMIWIATPQRPATPDALCTECHRPNGLAAEEPGGKLLHPDGPSTAARVKALKVELPLFGENGERNKQGFVACATCHNPHARPGGPPDMLRNGATPEPNSLCMQCHPGTAHINTSLHSPPLLQAYAGAKRICGPCHAVHAEPDLRTTDMWAGPLGPASEVAVVRECTGCHSPGGGAPVIKWVPHPAVLMQNLVPPTDPSFMPLVNEKGQVGSQGRIVCITCHLPHGRSASDMLPGVKPAEIDLPDLRAVMPMLRPYIAPNLCDQCHGFDGLRRFLYFHYPEKRHGLSGLPTSPP